MSQSLYDKYGFYNLDGFWISNHERWHFFAEKPSVYRRRKILAYLALAIPISGIIIADRIFEEMGLSLL